MSSYLTFYIKEKDKEGNWKDPVSLLSFSKSNEIYRAFKDNGAPYAFSSREDSEDDSDEMVYGDVTENMIRFAKSSVDKSISDIEKNITLTKENLPETASERMEMLDYIREMEEDLECFVRTKYYIDFIEIMVDEAKYSETEKVIVCNVD